MGKIIIDAGINPAIGFNRIVNNLKEIADERNLLPQEVIQMFISDLQNYLKKDYKQKIEEINIQGGFSSSVKGKLVTYLERTVKTLDKTKKGEAKKQERKEKNASLSRVWENVEKNVESMNSDELCELIKNINEGAEYLELTETERKYVLKNLTALTEKRKKAEENEIINRTKAKNKKWNEIEKIVARESENSQLTKIEIWDAIYKAAFGQRRTDSFNIEIPESIKDEIKELVEKQCEEDGKEYFSEVRRYTSDFRFLGGPRDVVFATFGHRSFSRKEDRRMFANLVAELKKAESADNPETELELLNRVLSENIIGTYSSKKFIEARINLINKENDLIKKGKNTSVRPDPIL